MLVGVSVDRRTGRETRSETRHSTVVELEGGNDSSSRCLQCLALPTNPGSYRAGQVVPAATRPRSTVHALCLPGRRDKIRQACLV